MKVVVISITQYKEKDAIIDAISEDGAFSFNAKGVFDPANKNSAINSTLVTADIELTQGKSKYPILKACSILDTPLKRNDDFYYLSATMLIAEATKCLVQDEEKKEIYPSLIKSLEALKNADEPWFILLTYLADVLRHTGYDFEVNKCVICGSKKDIVTFSFEDGGFVCRNCITEETERDLSSNQMMLLRAAFNNLNYEPECRYCNIEDAIVVLDKFSKFIDDGYGIHLKSIGLLNK